MSAQAPASANAGCSGSFTDYAGSSNPITVAAWYRNTGGYGTLTGGVYPIFSINNQQTSTGSRILLAVSGSVSSRVFIFDILSTPLSGTYRGTLTDAGWHHLCGVITSATDRKFYEDGTEIRSSTASVTVNASTMCSILGLREGSSYGLNSNTSQVADIGVWNTNLTSGEVYSLSRGFTCDKIRPQNLIFYDPLMSGQYLQDITKSRSFVIANDFILPAGTGSAPALY